jgi:ribosomal protein S12 methylthiotransferase accessory factor
VPRYYRGEGAQERALAKSLIFPTGDAYLDELQDAIVRQGLDLRVSILDEPPLANVALAFVSEPKSEPPMAHIGLGCSLSPAHAIERALTEAIQSRVVDVQAAREDIRHANDPAGSVHGKRISALPRGRWFADLPAEGVRLGELCDRASDDLAHDVRTLLAQLREGGINVAIAIEIFGDASCSVVRICAPDFETTVVDGRIGPIGLQLFNPLAN